MTRFVRCLGSKANRVRRKTPSQGNVWQSIIRQIDRADSQDEFISTADVPRATFFPSVEYRRRWSCGA